MSAEDLSKIDAEIKTLKEANDMLKKYSQCYDVLDEAFKLIIEGRLVMSSIGAEELKTFTILMTKMQAALVRAQGGHRVGHAKVD